MAQKAEPVENSLMVKLDACTVREWTYNAENCKVAVNNLPAMHNYGLQNSTNHSS